MTVSQRFFEVLKGRLAKATPKPVAKVMALRDASVMAPLFWRDDAPFALLTKRPMTLSKHPGQIAFPGGGRERADITPLHTALRETEEELGIPQDAVTVLGMLSSVPTPSGFQVTPFVGAIADGLELRPSPSEIEEILWVPLLRLRPVRRVLHDAERDAFLYDDAPHVIWGATHRMIRELLPHVHAAFEETT